MSKIKDLFTKKLSTRLVLLFLAISLIPVIITGVLSVKNSYDALQDSEFSQLQSVGKLKTDAITSYLNDKFTEVHVLAKSGDAIQSFYKLSEYHDKIGALDNSSYAINTQAYEQIYQDIDPFFDEFKQDFNFYDVLLVCAKHGHVMYSTDRNSDLGENLQTGKLKNSGLAKVWQHIVQTEKMMVADFAYYEPAQRPASFVGAPIFDETGELVAVVIAELDTSEINNIMQSETNLGESGETYMVGEDLLMRSDSRQTTESDILNTKVDTESTRLAFQGKQGVHEIENYREIPVLSYFSGIQINEDFEADFEWVIVAEVEQDEAYQEAIFLENGIIIITIIIGIIVFFIALFFSRRISKPIMKLTASAQAFALGDLSKKFDIKRQDEIGLLAAAFKSLQQNMRDKAQQAVQISEGNLTFEVQPLSDKDEMGKAFGLMVKNLKEQIEGINEVVAILTSSNSQLMSTIAELSSSSNETATTVSEITTTISEVKQTAEVSAQKAQSVSNTAQKSLQISEKGIASTEDTMEGMNNIHEQVKKIADTIIKLSEQSQTIGDITNSVNDLAEQSNLLALNASIEAVKAGEYGKGFGVVAQEIRTLADQSKQATRQIRDILSEVQKSISSAVMATEQGGKAVDKGLELTEDAGDSISMLADSIAEASQASAQIAASSKQQLTGMEQLASAMDNIKTAATQNATGAKQAEDAVGNIKTIVENLNNLIVKYKVK